MFAKLILSALALFSFMPALITFSVATPTRRTGAKCNTGPIECCQTLTPVNSQDGREIAHSVGLDVGSLYGYIGAHCSPITVIGAGQGASCHSAPVCCEKNNVHGFVAVGCLPVNL
ncbi:hydrophobin [Amanita muscaria]